LPFRPLRVLEYREYTVRYKPCVRTASCNSTQCRTTRSGNCARCAVALLDELFTLHSPGTHPVLTRYSPRTHPVLTPYSPRAHPVLTPYSPRAHPVLTPCSPRAHPVLTACSPRTHPARWTVHTVRGVGAVGIRDDQLGPTSAAGNYGHAVAMPWVCWVPRVGQCNAVVLL
jgi:hypothetical protein